MWRSEGLFSPWLSLQSTVVVARPEASLENPVKKLVFHPILYLLICHSWVGFSIQPSTNTETNAEKTRKRVGSYLTNPWARVPSDSLHFNGRASTRPYRKSFVLFVRSRKKFSYSSGVIFALVPECKAARSLSLLKQ